MIFYCLLRDTPKTPNDKIKFYKKEKDKNMGNQDFERTIRMSFRVTPDEKHIIENRALQTNTNSMSAYIRHMAINGIIVNYENKEIKELIKSLGKIGVNINQIATRVNSTNNMYIEDVHYLRKVMNEIWQSVLSIQSTLQALGQ